MLPGDLFTFEAIDEGDASGLQCPARSCCLGTSPTLL